MGIGSRISLLNIGIYILLMAQVSSEAISICCWAFELNIVPIELASSEETDTEEKEEKEKKEYKISQKFTDKKHTDHSLSSREFSNQKLTSIHHMEQTTPPPEL